MLGMQKNEKFKYAWLALTAVALGGALYMYNKAQRN